MTFKRSKSEHLADYIRCGIQRRELSEPLPNTREWSHSLGVSRNTLKKALNILRKDGLLEIEARKSIRIIKGAHARAKMAPSLQKVLRLIYYPIEYPQRSFFGYYHDLAEHLYSYGIYTTWEACTHARIREISRQPQKSNELLFLASVPGAYHRYFHRRKSNTLVVGMPDQNSSLPYIAVDIKSCIRHATQFLLRRNFSRISFLIGKVSSHSLADLEKIFLQTCAGWRHQPIYAEVVRMGLAADDQRSACRRFAAGVNSRQGIIALQPVWLSMLMTALFERGVRIPEVGHIVALMTTPQNMNVCPLPSHYPFPQHAFVKQLTDQALHYFNTGALRNLRMVIPTDIVAAAE